ncbi:MAG: PKD domain-containing protein, partial [Bacteroidetes bacterium]
LGTDSVAVCDSAVLDAGNPGASYFWTGPNPGNQSTTQQTFTVLATGTYTVTVTALGCTATDTVIAEVFPAPAVELGDDFASCNPVTLDAGSDGVSYTWSTGDTTQTVMIMPPTTGTDTISVSVTNSFGCVVDDEIAISAGVPPMVDLGPDTTACDSYELTTMSVPGATYLWSTGETSPAITATTTDTYVVTVTDSTGCEASDTVQVDVTPTPVAAATFDNPNYDFTVDFVNQSTPPTGADYLWDFGDGFGTSTDASPSYTYVLPGTYQITLIVSNECGSDTTQFLLGGVSVDDDAFSRTLEVYPNPTQGLFHISSRDLQAEELTIEVTDARGRVILERVISNVFGGFTQPVDLSAEAEGVYNIRISDGEHTATKRVIRN